MEVRGRRSREMMMSPERIKICTGQQPTRVMRPVFKRVQVVYYLSRNGQLEHPHYVEVTHLANQQLRLKDVIDRLIVLRGKGMPSLYSWSCKRSYKNGYVWNDLGENDIIYPSEGAEYILKGSEVIIDGCNGKFPQLQISRSQEQFQQLQLVNTQHHLENLNFHPKRKPQNRYENEVEENDENEEELEEVEYEEKIRYPYTTTTATSAATHSRCSKGVSTEEVHQEEQEQEHQQNPKNPTTEINLENSSSPPSTTSSSLSDKGVNENTNTSRRLEDGDPVINKPLLSRNSMLFQLIACGGGAVSFQGKNVPVAKQPPAPQTAARRSSCSDLHKGVLCKSVNNNNNKAAAVVDEVEEDDEIKCMSENPRFGNLQSEEKEYFSGSIVESISTEGRARHIVEPSSLKKSSSYNEERGSKLAMADDAAVGRMEEEAVKRDKSSNSSKGKCIPRMKSACSKPQSKK